MKMSEKPTNPAQKFIKFKKGKFAYWDKTKEADVEIPYPFNFVLLQKMITVTGYDQEKKRGIFSNEVLDFEDTLYVKRFAENKGDDAELLIAKPWGTKKTKSNGAEIKSKGGKYTLSCYGVMDEELVNIAFSGLSLSALIEAENSIKVPKGGYPSLTFSGAKDFDCGQYGSHPKPAIGIEIPELYDIAMSISKHKGVKEYLSKYTEWSKSVNAGVSVPDKKIAVPVKEEITPDDLPF